MTDWLLNFPLGTLLGWFIDQFNSYGWGLLGFTVAIKVILLPLGLIQQRSTINQMKVRPQEEAIRKQCGADKMRANLEVSNLYKENGISAAAGCLPMLVQLPILFSLYKIIRMPLTYVVKLSASQISALDAALGLNLLTAERVSHTAEITIAEALFSNLPAMVDAGLVEPGIRTFSYNFLGMNLAEHPSLAFNMLLLVPIFSGLTAFLQSWYQMKSVPSTAATERMQIQMLFTMPIVSVWIAFTMPSGMGLYWGFSSLLMMFQSMLLNAIWNPKKTLAAAYAAQEAKEELAKQERLARRKANLGGLKAGQQPPEEPQPASPPPMSPQVEAQMQAMKERKRKNYAKVLGFRDHIPDPIDHDLPPVDKSAKGGDEEE